MLSKKLVNISFYVISPHECIFPSQKGPMLSIKIYTFKTISLLILQVLKIDDNYCGKHEEVNSPSEGLIPVKSEAATTMKTVVTSLTVDIVKDHTVAFVGTENGHIMKVGLIQSI